MITQTFSDSCSTCFSYKGWLLCFRPYGAIRTTPAERSSGGDGEGTHRTTHGRSRSCFSFFDAPFCATRRTYPAYGKYRTVGAVHPPSGRLRIAPAPPAAQAAGGAGGVGGARHSGCCIDRSAGSARSAVARAGGQLEQQLAAFPWC